MDESPRILLSAGEASGDMYAAWLLEALKARLPGAQFFGCAGPNLRAAGCEAVVQAESLAVVGLAEVVSEIPRVWAEYRRLLAAGRERRPQLAILVDSPDFSLRVARRLRRQGVPVLYFIAPQAWAWRPWRARQIARDVTRLLCIFPFEEEWFRKRGVTAEYIGHPLAGRVRPSLSREQFFAAYALDPDQPLIAVLPGSRRREAAMNLPGMLEGVKELGVQAVLAAPPGLPLPETSLPVIRGATWDAVAHAKVALVASGTATIETALLGTPMVVVYRVTEPTWRFGRLLVRTPFYSMVNLVAQRRLVPELIQNDFTPSRVAGELERLLTDGAARKRMTDGLAEVAAKLATGDDPFQRAASRAVEMLRWPG